MAPKILKQVNLQGAIVLGDAMHTQRGIRALQSALFLIRYEPAYRPVSK